MSGYQKVISLRIISLIAFTLVVTAILTAADEDKGSSRRGNEEDVPKPVRSNNLNSDIIAPAAQPKANTEANTDQNQDIAPTPLRSGSAASQDAPVPLIPKVPEDKIDSNSSQQSNPWPNRKGISNPTPIPPTSPDKISAGRAMNEAHKCYVYKRYAEAEPLYKEAISNYEKAYGSKSEKLLGALSSAAMNYLVQGKYKDAEPIYRKMLEIEDAAKQPRYVDISTTLNNLAFTLCRMGRYSEAEPFYKRSLDLEEQHHDQFWGDHFKDRFKTMQNYSDMLRKTNRNQEADQWKTKANELRYGKYPALPPR